jgi:hypothetical protein
MEKSGGKKTRSSGERDGGEVVSTPVLQVIGGVSRERVYFNAYLQVVSSNKNTRFRYLKKVS